MDQIELGKFINKLRIEANLTQDELAKKVDVGSGKTVSKWENGYSMPDFITLKKLSIALNVTLYELSECKRLKKKKYIEATKDYIKSSLDIFKLSIIGKVTLVITILLGIFFGLCAVFTIDNYGTVEIYTIKSLDANYYIEGNIVLTKEYNVFNLTNLDYIGKDDSFLNTNAYNINYSIIRNISNELISYQHHNTIDDRKQCINLLQIIKNTRFNVNFDSLKQKEIHFNDNIVLTFKITYEDKDKNFSQIKFPFKIIRKYINNHL